MKILQICSYYINDKFYFYLFSALESIGIKSQPYVFANRNRKKDKIIIHGAVVSYCFYSVDRFFFHLKHRKVLGNLIECINPSEYDCVHAHSIFSNGYLAYCIKKKYQIPYVVTVRYPDILTFFKYLIYLRHLGKKILLNASDIIFLSKSSKKSLETYLDSDLIDCINKKSYIIPNGIDNYWLVNRQEKLKIIRNKNKIRLLFVGKVNKNKNPDVLIGICKTLYNMNISVELTIVGEMQEKRYKKVFERYDFIKYHPNCCKEELLQYYRNADIFVMLSYKETFGLVYLEAMSQGLPIIYSRGQGFDGQFQDGEVGYACNPDNVAGAVDSILNIIENYERISLKCVDMSQMYSWDIIANNIKSVYKNSINLIEGK